MPKQKANAGFGALPPRYHFALNPYPEMRFTRCPWCEAKTGQRKLPLMIHIHPDVLLAFNYTNRYCKQCDLLIAHKVDIEHYLTEMFRTTEPDMIGNDYLIFGTAEKKAWKEGMRRSKPVHDMRAHIHDFKSYEELRMTRGAGFRRTRRRRSWNRLPQPSG